MRSSDRPLSHSVSEPIKVDIWSDVQCPWCYIGKRRFESALDGFNGEVEVEYHSFELAPDVPLDFVGTTVDYLTERKGLSRDQVEVMLDRVTGIAEGEGLEYHLHDAQQVNTVRAHELIHHANELGLQEPMKERLFRAYFTESRNLGDIDTLVELAEEVGIEADDARAALEDNRHLPAVKADMAQAREYGIQGVPFFVIDGRYGISGAQETDTCVRALNQVVADRA